MGARGLDKRGSFFKVKGNWIWDLNYAPSAWQPEELQAPEAAGWSLKACWLDQLGPGELVCEQGWCSAGWGFCGLIVLHWLGAGAEMPHG